MATCKTTLRFNLLLIIGWLGVISVLLLLWMLVGVVGAHVSLREERQRAREMDAVIRIAFWLRQEDLAVVRCMAGDAGPMPPDVAARHTDRALAQAIGLFGEGESVLDARVVRGLDTLRDRLPAQRKGIDRAGRAVVPDASLQRWRGFADEAYVQLEAMTHDLIRADGGRARPLAADASLRHFILLALRVSIAERFEIERGLLAQAAGKGFDAALGRSVREASAQLQGAALLAEDQLLAGASAALTKAGAAAAFLTADYIAAGRRLLEAGASGPAPAEVVADWRRVSELAVDRLAEAEAALAAEAEARLGLAERRAVAALAVWGAALVLCAALSAFAVRFTLRRIVQPLERVHAKMLRLAHDDLAVEIGTRPRLAEIQAMYDALAVFKENGLRRLRMQAELARLNDRVVEANRTMTAELEAAAKVQAAQLPAPCSLPGARFDSHYRPSRMISGDTYDFVTYPDGRTRLFQIDVSGHGAAAALVSVISHLAVQTALQQAGPEENLVSIVGRINREWDDALPYFTMVLVEIDPRAGEARVVQAGHPPVLRLPARGGVQSVGEGGLPVGALPWAEYEVCTCPFLAGDRLVLATDGVTEAADHDGALFGDARFLDLLERFGRADLPTLFGRLDAALWDWCGTEAFDDDVTILILEAKESAYAN